MIEGGHGDRMDVAYFPDDNAEAIERGNEKNLWKNTLAISKWF
jgi:hypothetical protein